MNVNLVTAKNIKLNVTRKNMFPAHLVVLKAEAEVPVPMITALLTLNVTVPIIMNGVPRKRNAFVQLLSNILAPARGIQEETEQLVTANTHVVIVPMVLHGMLLKEHVFVPALISAR